MDNDSECLGDAASASPVAWFAAFEPQPDPAAYRFEDIGYEAADPSLQASLWREPMQALSAAPDGR